MPACGDMSDWAVRSVSPPTKSVSVAPNLAVTLAIAASASSAIACLAFTLLGAPASTTLLVVDGGLTIGALVFASAAAWRTAALLTLLVTLNFVVLAFLAQNAELKALRDPLVVIAFLLLGWTHGGHDRARVAFFAVGAAAILIGVIEWISPSLYTDFFDVLGFYIARGEVTEDRAALLQSDLFVSGLRPGGRYFLSFLGPHRVSSIFLEPVAMGNFGVIAAAYGLSRPSAHRRDAIVALSIATIAIIAADARFAMMSVGFLVLARLVPLRGDALVILLMPAVVLLFLVAWGLMSGVGSGDDLATRLAHSGRVVARMSVADWYGVASGPLASLDSGYYYLFRRLGLPMTILLWTCFAFLPARSEETRRYKLMLAVYMSLLLAISGSSLFALKTAGLAFFLLGAMLSKDYGPPRLGR
jgi:putative polymerase